MELLCPAYVLSKKNSWGKAHRTSTNTIKKYSAKS